MCTEILDMVKKKNSQLNPAPSKTAMKVYCTVIIFQNFNPPKNKYEVICGFVCDKKFVEQISCSETWSA